MTNIKKAKVKRARTKKGRFIADDPRTLKNEAFVSSEVPISHIREATNKAKKPKPEFFLMSWLEKVCSILGVNYGKR